VKSVGLYIPTGPKHESVSNEILVSTLHDFRKSVIVSSEFPICLTLYFKSYST